MVVPPFFLYGKFVYKKNYISLCFEGNISREKSECIEKECKFAPND
jgi:hypothetical protein